MLLCSSLSSSDPSVMGWDHDERDYNQDRNVSSCNDKSDQSEVFCLDLQRFFPLNGQVETNPA